MVTRQRGGFCYELNLLLAAALRALGFEVDLLEGQMRRREGGFGPPYDHMTLRIALEDRDWLADVGNGVRKRFGVPSAMFLPGRVTYVIDPEGVVRLVFNALLNAKAHVQQARACLEQLAR